MTEREAFEAWASSNGEFPRAIERGSNGYLLMATATAWNTWLAACAWQREHDAKVLWAHGSMVGENLAVAIRAQGER